jgi:hypothetical protein
MAINSAVFSKRSTAVELHLRVPVVFVRRMRLRVCLRALLFNVLSMSLVCVLALLLPSHWLENTIHDIFYSPIIFLLLISAGMSLMYSPWVGISSKGKEWYLSKYGLSLKDSKNPVDLYGTIFISAKRDTIISVKQTHWQEYPALGISWQHGRGKIKSGLVVYRLEDELLVSETLMPMLAAWPQIATGVEASAN